MCTSLFIVQRAYIRDAADEINRVQNVQGTVHVQMIIIEVMKIRSIASTAQHKPLFLLGFSCTLFSAASKS